MAQAHSPIAGIGTFYGAMLHPLLVPAHALALIALSLALGQQGRRPAQLGLTGLILAFCAGLALALTQTDAAPSETALLVVAALLASFVILARPLPAGVMAGAASVIGVMLGLDSAPDPAGPEEMMLAVAGLCVGVVVLSALVAGTCLTFEKDWQKIGIRVVGSWIAAAAVLVLALQVHGGRQTEARSQKDLARTETLS